MSAKDLKNKDLHWRERFKPYQTKSDVWVFPIYYRMNPDFDPERNGKDWYKAKKKLYENKPEEFRQEFEIDFGSIKGGLVYPEWSVRRNVLLNHIPLQEDWYYQCIVDPGVAVTAVLWQAIVPRFKDEDGRLSGGWIIRLDEYYEGDSVFGSKHKSATRHAEAIMARTQMHCDRVLGKTSGGKSRKGGQSWIDVTYMDPSAWRREGSHEDIGSVALRYLDAGMLSLEPANTKDVDGGIERVKQLDAPHIDILHPEGLIDVDGEGFPVNWVFPHMGNFIKEKLAYRRDPKTGKIVKKKDHLMDCERMGSVNAAERYEKVQPVVYSAAYNRINKLKKTRNKGGYAGAGRYGNSKTY